MNATLYNKLIEYSNTKLAFHMPGHKFGTSADLNQVSLLKLDNTEAVGMDNLYEADGIIEEAMRLMAEFYSSKSSIFLTNGSTVGILASILSICKPGDQLIVARNAHHSVWSALILSGVSPIYVMPKYVHSGEIITDMDVNSIEEAYKQYPKAKGVLIVSPTYEGIVSDIESIADVTHKYGGILIVDEAHGAHFVLDDKFPQSSIKLGADLVVNSMHKTLPTLTQSGLLHICSDRVSYDQVINVLRMVQTSSPSYMMMGIMDYARGYILEHRKEIEQTYILELIQFREQLKKHLKVLTLVEFEEIFDISKVIISTQGTNISGYELEEMLNDRFNIAIEAALDRYIIVMTTLADNKETLLRLQEALLSIDSIIKKTIKSECMNSFFRQKISLGNNPRDIFYSSHEWIDINECVNRISAKNIMLYPPGIPIVAIGEIFNIEEIKYINKFKEKLQGIQLIHNKVLVEVTK